MLFCSQASGEPWYEAHKLIPKRKAGCANMTAKFALVSEQAYDADLKSAAERLVGSSPTESTPLRLAIGGR